jgi:hypothetical protein
MDRLLGAVLIYATKYFSRNELLNQIEAFTVRTIHSMTSSKID